MVLCQRLAVGRPRAAQQRPSAAMLPLTLMLAAATAAASLSVAPASQVLHTVLNPEYGAMPRKYATSVAGNAQSLHVF